MKIIQKYNTGVCLKIITITIIIITITIIITLVINTWCVSNSNGSNIGIRETIVIVNSIERVNSIEIVNSKERLLTL